MARPREFDIDVALDRAMDVFWARGYEGASLPHLLHAMGIARGSLYKAFKDKRSIYLAALDRYDQTVVQDAVDMLGDPAFGSGRERVQALFLAARDAVAVRSDRRGCLFCNAAVDQAPYDPKVAAKVFAITKRLERAIAMALKESEGPSAAAKGPVKALLLINAYVGLRVLARAGYPVAELEQIIETTLHQAGL